MANILLKNKVTNSTNVLVITENFKNEFNLPDKVNDYIVNELSQKDKKTLTYNYIGKFISIFIVEKGKEISFLNEQLRRHGSIVADSVNLNKGKDLYIYNQTKQQSLSLFAAEGMVLGNYQFIKHKPTAEKNKNTLQSIIIANTNIKQSHIDELNIVCSATILARDLVNEPVNYLNATDLSNAFKTMGKLSGFKVDVLNRKKIKELKMGGLLAVNAGSVDEPTFSVMEYKPNKPKNKKSIFCTTCHLTIYRTIGH